MLKYSFRQIKGIGAKRERELWSRGIYSWDDFEHENGSQLRMFNLYSEESDPLYDSRRALEIDDADFFATNLPRQEHHRIALGFPEQTLFFDIETTGLSRYYDTITLVGWSVGANYQVFIKGQDFEPLRAALLKAKAIVTFNGSIFDLPFVKHEFPETQFPTTHIDLRFLSKRVGLTGGQKEVEKLIGLERPSHLQDFSGVSAPLLWYRYKQGDVQALKFLISYNHADIEGMKHILDRAVDRLAERDLLPACALPFYRFSEHVAAEPEWAEDGFSALRGKLKLEPYRGRRGPLITLKDLAKRVSKLRIIGVDLTGSEKKASGWCLVHGKKTTTRMIASDDEIVEASVECKPDLISIDSPLSLPHGRLIVTDDDPGRHVFGITRYCERILKKRGVNVYPSLIRSMQNLTARGIKLATRFRALGIPVIESYPGAAQDIIGIPRKRADVGLLKAALGEFGLRGAFTSKPVTHDELDAITSAIVGQFFLNGNFEALGNTEEEYLIIPEISSDKNAWGARRIIGLSGPIAAGKTTAARILESLGFTYGRYSLILKELLERREIPVTRESLQKIGEEVYNSPGQRWLGRQVFQRLPENGNLVVDGLRHPEDHALLVETFGPDFLHVHISASLTARLERYIAEGHTKEDFERANSHPVEGNVQKLATLANVTVMNYDSKELFQSEVLQKFGENV